MENDHLQIYSLLSCSVPQVFNPAYNVCDWRRDGVCDRGQEQTTVTFLPTTLPTELAEETSTTTLPSEPRDQTTVGDTTGLTLGTSTPEQTTVEETPGVTLATSTSDQQTTVEETIGVTLIATSTSDQQTTVEETTGVTLVTSTSDQTTVKETTDVTLATSTSDQTVVEETTDLTTATSTPDQTTLTNLATSTVQTIPEATTVGSTGEVGSSLQTTIETVTLTPDFTEAITSHEVETTQAEQRTTTALPDETTVHVTTVELQEKTTTAETQTEEVTSVATSTAPALTSGSEGTTLTPTQEPGSTVDFAISDQTTIKEESITEQVTEKSVDVSTDEATTQSDPSGSQTSTEPDRWFTTLLPSSEPGSTPSDIIPAQTTVKEEILTQPSTMISFDQSSTEKITSNPTSTASDEGGATTLVPIQEPDGSTYPSSLSDQTTEQGDSITETVTSSSQEALTGQTITGTTPSGQTLGLEVTTLPTSQDLVPTLPDRGSSQTTVTDGAITESSTLQESPEITTTTAPIIVVTEGTETPAVTTVEVDGDVTQAATVTFEKPATTTISSDLNDSFGTVTTVGTNETQEVFTEISGLPTTTQAHTSLVATGGFGDITATQSAGPTQTTFGASVQPSSEATVPTESLIETEVTLPSENQALTTPGPTEGLTEPSMDQMTTEVTGLLPLETGAPLNLTEGDLYWQTYSPVFQSTTQSTAVDNSTLPTLLASATTVGVSEQTLATSAVSDNLGSTTSQPVDSDQSTTLSENAEILGQAVTEASTTTTVHPEVTEPASPKELETGDSTLTTTPFDFWFTSTPAAPTTTMDPLWLMLSNKLDLKQLQLVLESLRAQLDRLEKQTELSFFPPLRIVENRT